MACSRDGVQDVPVEVGVVHDGCVSALFAGTPLRPKAVAKALAVATLAAALVVRVRVQSEESHQRVELTHLERPPNKKAGGTSTNDVKVDMVRPAAVVVVTIIMMIMRMMIVRMIMMIMMTAFERRDPCGTPPVSLCACFEGCA